MSKNVTSGTSKHHSFSEDGICDCPVCAPDLHNGPPKAHMTSKDVSNGVSQPPASEQYASWKRWPHTYREPAHHEWLREIKRLHEELKRANGYSERYAGNAHRLSVSNDRLREALEQIDRRYKAGGVSIPSWVHEIVTRALAGSDANSQFANNERDCAVHAHSWGKPYDLRGDGLIEQCLTCDFLRIYTGEPVCEYCRRGLPLKDGLHHDGDGYVRCSAPGPGDGTSES